MALGAGALLFVLVFTAGHATGASGQSADALPDLVVAPLRHNLLEITADGKRRIRFTASIANVGKGPMEVRAARLSLGSPFLAWQQVSRTDGSSHRMNLPGVGLTYVGSKEHGHWHIRGAARYELRALGSAKPIRIHYKRGFCLFDSTAYDRSLAGAPRKPAYPRDDCGKKSTTSLAMGVSIGWKDDYYWRIPGQEIDITGLENGKYRLLVKVDPRNWFRETNDRNNVTWVDVEIGDQFVKVIGRSKRQ